MVITLLPTFKCPANSTENVMPPTQRFRLYGKNGRWTNRQLNKFSLMYKTSTILLLFVHLSVFGQKIAHADWTTIPPCPTWSDNTLYIPNQGTYFVEFDTICYVTRITFDRTVDAVVLYAFVDGVGYQKIDAQQNDQVRYLNRRTRYIKISYTGIEPMNIWFSLK